MNFSKGWWWIILAAWILGSTYWHVCKIKNLCDADLLPTHTAVSNNTTDQIPSESITPLVIKDSSTLIVESKGNFLFAKNSDKADQQTIDKDLTALVNYLHTNKGKKLLITGQYAAQETNTSAFPNLGLARANNIKQWLVSQGIADSLVSTNSKLLDSIAFHNDHFYGGIDFTFPNFTAATPVTIAPKLSTEIELANSQKFENIFKPLDLYFPKASTGYIKTDQNQMFIAEAKKFLIQNKDKKLVLTGHTDDEDSAEWNLKLSKQRAGAVKKQFVAAGIDPDRIVATGKGEWEPKASNATEAGKRANRRVTIVVR